MKSSLVRGSQASWSVLWPEQTSRSFLLPRSLSTPRLMFKLYTQLFNARTFGGHTGSRTDKGPLQDNYVVIVFSAPQATNSNRPFNSIPTLRFLLARVSSTDATFLSQTEGDCCWEPVQRDWVAFPYFVIIRVVIFLFFLSFFFFVFLFFVFVYFFCFLFFARAMVRETVTMFR